MEVHVVSKADNGHHAAFALKPSSAASVDTHLTSQLQIRPLLVSLSSNNLSYARAGEFLHWWDAYPVPEDVPPPYNDSTAWGIVPAWGYGVVVRSGNSAIPQGTVFWGFWPTADMLVLLDLKPTKPAGCWKEVSQHRQRMMTLYNIYHETGKTLASPLNPTIGQDELQNMAWEALFRPTWQSGYLISQHVFSPKDDSIASIHPLGVGEWSTADADLSRTLLVSLSASGKTARSFAYNVLRRSKSSGPLGFLQVTSSPSSIADVPQILKSPVRTKAISYSDISDTMEWVAGLNPSRVVVVDFGARENALASLVDSVKARGVLADVKMTILQVGSQQKVYSNKDQQAAAQEMSKFGKIQFNASGVRDAATGSLGAEAFNKAFGRAWNGWLEVSHTLMPDIRVVQGQGISGKDGVEGGWDRLSRGQVDCQEGLVYIMSNLT